MHLGPDLFELTFQPGHPVPGQRHVGLQEVGVVLGAHAAGAGTHWKHTTQSATLKETRPTSGVGEALTTRPGRVQRGQDVVEVVVLVLGQIQPLLFDVVNFFLGL